MFLDIWIVDLKPNLLSILFEICHVGGNQTWIDVKGRWKDMFFPRSMFFDASFVEGPLSLPHHLKDSLY